MGPIGPIGPKPAGGGRRARPAKPDGGKQTSNLGDTNIYTHIYIYIGTEDKLRADKL